MGYPGGHGEETAGLFQGGILLLEEGLCVQCMHIGPYDDEPTTVAAMDEYARFQGCELDFSQGRFHHETYLSDIRRTKPEKLKTVIRQPIKRAE